MQTQRCLDCGHRVAFHRPIADAVSSTDYHAQYDTGAFLAALEQTRIRQARRITACIRAELPDADALLDFGAGRGWLLEEARRVGLRRCAAADSSAQAVSDLRGRGFDAVELPSDLAGWVRECGGLPFRPRILTLLDVVEHFPPADLRSWLHGLVDGLRPELALVVLKVPLSEGLFFRSADWLAALGAAGPLEQLYQVGTAPPHSHYFCIRSMRRLLARLGLEVLRVERDRDFEARELVGRVRALRRMPRPLATAVGWVTTAVVELSPLRESGIFFARPRA